MGSRFRNADRRSRARTTRLPPQAVGRRAAQSASGSVVATLSATARTPRSTCGFAAARRVDSCPLGRTDVGASLDGGARAGVTIGSGLPAGDRYTDRAAAVVCEHSCGIVGVGSVLRPVAQEEPRPGTVLASSGDRTLPRVAARPVGAGGGDPALHASICRRLAAFVRGATLLLHLVGRVPRRSRDSVGRRGRWLAFCQSLDCAPLPCARARRQSQPATGRQLRPARAPVTLMF